MPAFSRRRTSTPSLQTVRYPAPTGGVNAVDSALAMPATDCVYGYNVIPDELGLRARTGYREWATGITGASDNGIRDMVPFRGSLQSRDKLFAASSTGLWDVSSSTASPSLVLTYTNQGGNAGFGQSVAFENSAGHFLFHCDEQNGLYLYTESLGTWARPSITGVTLENVVAVCVHKERLWMVLRDSATAYYLAVNAIGGAATAFPLGAQFKAGGSLQALANWTYDGGSGMDDSLVALSSGGDVVIYQGINPASASEWGLKGVWNIAGVPIGRRIAHDLGGDLWVLCSTGLARLSQLVVGAAATGATRKVAPLFSSLVGTYGSYQGWHMSIHPTDNVLMVVVPTTPGQETQQHVMSLTTGGWYEYRDLPLVSSCVWNGELYFGTDDGRVMRQVGWVDNVLLSDITSWASVKASFLPAFQGTGAQTQIQMVRPIFLAGTSSVSASSTARYDFNFTEPAEPSGNGGGGLNAWDSGTWDSAVWGGEYEQTAPIHGVSGIGRAASVAIRFNATSRTVFCGMDVHFASGGVL